MNRLTKAEKEFIELWGLATACQSCAHCSKAIYRSPVYRCRFHRARRHYSKNFSSIAMCFYTSAARKSLRIIGLRMAILCLWPVYYGWRC